MITKNFFHREKMITIYKQVRFRDKLCIGKAWFFNQEIHKMKKHGFKS